MLLLLAQPDAPVARSPRSGSTTASNFEGTAEIDVLGFYQLTGGYAVDDVYVAEGIAPTVHTGESVQAGQQLGMFIPGGGIETGFAAAPGSPVSTRAAALGQQAATGDVGANRTYCGQAMSDLIQRAHGPAGLTEGRPVIGTSC